MADISKITDINGNTYDLKDAVARNKTEIFWCTISGNNPTTYADITSALSNNKLPCVRNIVNDIYTYIGINESNNEYVFFGGISELDGGYYARYTYCSSSSVWSSGNLREIASTSSPDFTGTPTAPTASSGTSTMQIATTAFVQGELSNLAIPENTSDLVNDSGFISTETDPTVPAWAKAESKPTYTASEVGALPDTTVIPSDTSDLTNGAGFITAAQVPQEIFWCTYGTTTFAEITAALAAGKLPVVNDSMVFSLTYSGSTYYEFSGIVAGALVDTYNIIRCKSDNTWVTSTSVIEHPQILYLTSRTVSVASNAEIFRITSSGINTSTVVLSCVFADPDNISGDVTWTSYSGYIAFNGTCTAATTADVILAQKSN